MTTLLQKIRWFFVRREIRKIINGLGNDKEVLRGTPREKLLKFHRGFGMYLRSSFREGRFGALRSYCERIVSQSGERMSFDALSSVATEKIWEVLQSEKGKSN